MKEKGKAFLLGVSAYLLAKSVLNLFLNHFGGSEILNLIVQAVLAAVLICRIPKGQFITGAALVIIACIHLPANLGGLPGTWIYLAEGIIDIAVAALLFSSPDVKAYMESGQNPKDPPELPQNDPPQE